MSLSSEWNTPELKHSNRIERYQTLEVPRLKGRTLQAVRIGWIVLTSIALLLIIGSLPGYASSFSGQLAHVPADQITTAGNILAFAGGASSLGTALLSLGLSTILFAWKFEENMAAALAYYLIIYGVVMAGPFEYFSGYWFGSIDFATSIQAILLATPTIAFFALFPNGRFVPHWMRWVLFASVIWGLSLFLVGPLNSPNISSRPVLLAILAICSITFLFFGLYAQVYRFRRIATRIERQQTKWVILGFSIWFLYLLGSSFPYFYLTSLPPDATFPWWAGLSELGWWLSLAVVPLCLTIAIFRFGLWNIDVYINRTLVYGGLSLTLIMVYLISVVLFSQLIGTISGNENSPLAIVISTLVIAALFNPMRTYIQRFIDRRFYRHKYDTQRTLERFSKTVRNEVDINQLQQKLMDTVAYSIQPDHLSIWLRENRET